MLDYLTLRWADRDKAGLRLDVGNIGRGFISTHFMGNKGTRTPNSKKTLTVHVQVDHAVVLAAEDQLEEEELAAQQYQEFQLGSRTKVRHM